MIAQFRQQLRSLVANQRHVIVLAVDGIPYDLACRTWRRARVTRAESVFPTTSSTAWLTALTGQSVEAHGVPGVVFTVGDSLVDVYTYKGPLGDAPPEDIFTDAAGYTPIAILGDLENTHCTWRDWLVQHAQHVTGYEFFRQESDPCDRLVAAVEHALTRAERCFVWCFLDADLYIHKHGYDDRLIAFLERLDAIAAEWSRDALVVAHSDHGLVPTRHDPRIAEVLQGYRMGGAGRTRWLYVDDEVRVRDELRRHLPASVLACSADAMFGESSLSRSRVGSIVLIAQDENFLVQDDYRFEHGSLTAAEIYVPFAEWRC